MEEDIEIIEDNIEMFIDTLYECYRQSAVKPFEKAIENLIARYKELKQENEQLKSELGYTRKLNYKGNHIPRID